MQESKKSAILEFFGLILGCISMSVGINAFLKPHTIAYCSHLWFRLLMDYLV